MIVIGLLVGLLASGQAKLFPFVDPRGPISHAGMAVLVEPLGVQAVDYKYTPPKPETAPSADWIWALPAKTMPLAVDFRRVITLPETPKSVRIRVSADVSYRLWINGHLVGRGPADPGRDYDTASPGPWLYDTLDVSEYFTKGKNCLAAEVLSGPLVYGQSTTGHPGLMLEASMAMPDGLESRLNTDAAWKAMPDEGMSVVQVEPGLPAEKNRVLQIDTAKEPSGWRLPEYDDKSWPSAAVSQFPRTATIPSEIPPCMEALYPNKGYVRATAGVKTGKEVVVSRDAEFSVRYDRILSGYIGLRIKGVAGAVVTVMPSERNAAGFNRAARVILKDGDQALELPFLDSFSTINIAVRGAIHPVTFEDIRAIFSSQPVQYKGSFNCSDPLLTQDWLVGRWVTQICMQTYHLDSPDHQEPISDFGDYLIEAMDNYETFGERWLIRQDLRKFARVLADRKYRNFHTSYALLWLRALVEYYQYTGDADLVKELAPTVYNLIHTWDTWVGKNGLISEAPNYMFMDWVQIAGFSGHNPPAVIGQGYMTALYYAALNDLATVAKICGDDARVQLAMFQRTKISEAFDRELWSPAKGMYRDGKPFQTHVKPSQWLPEDQTIETFSPHVNTLAVVAGLAPEKRRKTVMLAVMGTGTPACQPYFMHFIFDGLDDAGLFDQMATAQMRRWTIVEDTQSFQEMWTSGDLSHGWGATPVHQLSARVLGIEPLDPGFKRILIAPHICDLQWAKGSVPTPYGPVLMDWTFDGRLFKETFTIPAGTTAEARLPNNTRQTLDAGVHSLECLVPKKT